jgi:hypothetical protein
MVLSVQVFLLTQTLLGGARSPAGLCEGQTLYRYMHETPGLLLQSHFSHMCLKFYYGI